MRVRILPSATQGGVHQFLTSYVIDDTVAIDAGCIGFHGEPLSQARIGTVFLSHSHADHVCSLPIFVMNIEDLATEPLAVYGPESTLQCLRQDVFNGRTWPDFLKFTRNGQPLVTLAPLVAEQSVAVNGLTVTPVPVHHIVPTFGFVVDDGRSAVAFSSDTAPTERLWAIARGIPRLKAVFLGVSFPNSFEPLARKAGHLTPKLAGEEMAKIPAGITVFVVHIKASHRAEVVEELAALGLRNLAIAESGVDYEF